MKKYTEVYLTRKQTRVILVETDESATEEEIKNLANFFEEEIDSHYPYAADAIGNEYVTNTPEKDIPDFKHWTIYSKDSLPK